MTTEAGTRPLINGGSPTVFVSELTAAVHFYTDVLGMKLLYQAGKHFASVDAGAGLTIGLHPPGQRAPSPGTAGSIQIGLDVSRPIGEVVERLQARGVVFDRREGEPVVDDGAVKLAFFTDPDGNELYLCEQVH